MTLKEIDIFNFKNIGSARLDFTPGVNALLGNNGMGKSNLLEAIHLLCMARPMHTLPDNALINHEADAMMVKGNFLTDTGGDDEISCGIAKGKGKKMKRNGKEYTRLSEHIGRYPVVTVTPDDHKLVTGAGEERRKLMDMVISQADASYLTSLIRYTRSLESRNRMLRAGVKDNLLYESIENVMEENAAAIHKSRAQWVERMAPVVENIYSRLAGKAEPVSMSYRSQLNGTTLNKLLDERRQKDMVLGYTSGGIHRDDLEITLDSHSLRSLGSQGQLKTFTVALRLAIFDFLKQEKGITPLLLLDDIFDKLDASRVENIMKEVTTPGIFGQIFITDTNRKHLDDILSGMSGSSMLINVENGNFNPLTL